MPKDSTVSDLDRLYESSRAVKRPLMGQAYLNVAYFGGRQWVKFDGRQIFEPALDAGRSKLTDNRIRPTVLTRIAKKTKTRPVFVGVPRTQADDDISAARYAELALEWEWQQKQLARKLRMALVWADVAFAGFWKVWWNPEKGRDMQILCYGKEHDAAGEPITNQYGAPLTPADADHMPAEIAQVAEEKTIHMGDTAIDLKTFFEIYPDPLANEEGLESAQFLVEEGVYSPDYVHDHFDRDLEPDANPSGGVAESRMPTSLIGTGNPEGYKGVTLREYWHVPSSQHPHGRRVVWAKNEVLYEGDNPYPWLPYVMFGGTPVPGRFWPDCPVTDLISPQTELNKVKSQIADNGERIGNPPLAVPTTMPEGWNWHNLPGEQVPFQPTGGPNDLPQFLNMPEMPMYVQNQIGSIENSIREISGQHEVSSAQVPSGVTAASAINLLQEQDDTRLGPDIADMEDQLANAGRRLLWLLGRFCDDERMLRIAGDDGEWDFLAFKGQMLRGCDDIEVQSGSGMPQSKAARQAAIQQVLNLMIQNGKAPDERSLRRVLREYEVGGLESFFADMSRDVRQVNDENRRLAAGEELPINTFDDHATHIPEHQNFRKTAAYRRRVKADPKIDALFEAHVEAHTEELVSKAEAMAGGGQPTPPPPEQGGNGAIPADAALSSSQPSTSTSA